MMMIEVKILMKTINCQNMTLQLRFKEVEVKIGLLVKIH